MSQEVISRAEARLRGLTFYFTGRPCKHGHVALRLTKSGVCRGCRQQYYAKNAEHIRETARRYHQENRDKVLSYQRARRADNPEFSRAATKKHYLANRVSVLEYGKKYRKRNPSAHRAVNARRSAAKRNATPAWYGEWDEFVMAEAYNLCELRRQETGISWQLDHMVPLACKSACGLHVAENFQVIPAVMNNTKRHRLFWFSLGEWVLALK